MVFLIFTNYAFNNQQTLKIKRNNNKNTVKIIGRYQIIALHIEEVID
jgi:hypothetical protein